MKCLFVETHTYSTITKPPKVFLDNVPRLLGPGRHALESVNFKYCGVAEMTDQVIRHGTITILRVPLGEIGLAWQLNEPYFIEQSGLYAYNSPDFTFVDHQPANEKIVELGGKKIVSVWTGEVGIMYRNGELDVLDHGRHVIDAATHVFECFLSTQQKSLRLVSMTQDQKKKRAQTRVAAKDEYESKRAAAACTTKAPPGVVPHVTSSSGDALVDTGMGVLIGGGADDLYITNANNKSGDGKNAPGGAKAENRKIENNDRADMLACETKDLVKVGIRADVFYSICDPVKCCQKISYDEIEDLVRETAIATLTNIVLRRGSTSTHLPKHVRRSESLPVRHVVRVVVGIELHGGLVFDSYSSLWILLVHLHHTLLLVGLVRRIL